MSRIFRAQPRSCWLTKLFPYHYIWSLIMQLGQPPRF